MTSINFVHHWFDSAEIQTADRTLQVWSLRPVYQSALAFQARSLHSQIGVDSVCIREPSKCNGLHPSPGMATSWS